MFLRKNWIFWHCVKPAWMNWFTSVRSCATQSKENRITLTGISHTEDAGNLCVCGNPPSNESKLERITFLKSNQNWNDCKRLHFFSHLIEAGFIASPASGDYDWKTVCLTRFIPRGSSLFVWWCGEERGTNIQKIGVCNPKKKNNGSFVCL